jgi:Protein kinase domain
MNDPSKVESVFLAILDLKSVEARSAYLDDVCKNNPGLREQVNRLVAAHPKAGEFLEQPAVAAGDMTGAYVPTVEQAGTIVAGRYKLLESIGEGGMGEVWVADQLEPIRRRVALKLIKPGMDSRSVLGRFEAERQALALMDHPNIAKVLDAGTTADQRPYFVMELVKGTPITTFCDARKLSARERLELFIPVCQAIQHAHTEGISHRDIKPSNVLVALHDERPVPKVIDFGVAKAVGQQLTEKTIYTGFGSLVGTPTYMAPEQATFNQLDIDTRADVYALGVLLYELLAGSPPVEPERIKKAALDEVLRLVRDEEPPRPSQRLSTSQSKASIAAVRQTDPTKLAKLIRGELDWIVMKALEKDRNRRYETPNGFAADVQRYLAGEQVQAVPPSAAYRLRKFARKNRMVLTTAAAFVGMLLAAVAGITWQAGERRREQLEHQLMQENVAAKERRAIQLQLERSDAGLRDFKASEVKDALLQAGFLLSTSDYPDLQTRLETARKDLAMVQSLEEAFEWRWNLARGQIKLFPEKAKELYPLRFKEYGIELRDQSLEKNVALIRHSHISSNLRSGLTQWFFLQPTQQGLLALLDADDPDPVQTEIRAAVISGEQNRLLAILEKAELNKIHPDFATALGMYLPGESGLRVMNAVWSHRPDSFALAMAISARLTELDIVSGKAMEAVGWARTAVAIRPESAFAHHCLGVALGEAGDTEGRFVELQEAMRLAPRFQRAAALYIFSLLDPTRMVRTPQDRDKAFAMCKSLLQANPTHPVGHAGLYLIYDRESNWVEAARQYRGLYDAVMNSNKVEGTMYDLYSCPEVAFFVGLLGPGWRLEEVLTGLIQQGRSEEAFRLCEHCITQKEIEDLKTSWVYANRPHETIKQGVCAAVLWSVGRNGSPTLDDEGQKALSKGRHWLSALQNGWKACFDADPNKNRSQVHSEMTQWLSDPNLTKVQEKNVLAKLSHEERENWKKLWSEVKLLGDRSAPSEVEAPKEEK